MGIKDVEQHARVRNALRNVVTLGQSYWRILHLITDAKKEFDQSKFWCGQF